MIRSMRDLKWDRIYKLRLRKLQVVRRIDETNVKKSQSGWAFFLAEQRIKNCNSKEDPANVKGTIKEELREAAKKWHEMTPEQRKPFIDKAKIDRKRFDNEFESFKEKKIQQAIKYLEDNMKIDQKERKSKNWHRWLTSMKMTHINEQPIAVKVSDRVSNMYQK